MDRTEKAEVVETLKSVFNENTVVVFAHYTGMTVAELTDLRIKASAVGAGVKVVKNRLARLALEGHAGEGCPCASERPDSCCIFGRPNGRTEIDGRLRQDERQARSDWGLHGRNSTGR